MLSYCEPVFGPALYMHQIHLFWPTQFSEQCMHSCYIISQTILSGHPGILQQVAMATHEHPSAIATCFLVLATCNAFGASAPWAPTWQKANLLDVMKRPPGPPVNWVNPVKRTSQFLGLGNRFTWGFTKANGKELQRMRPYKTVQYACVAAWYGHITLCAAMIAARLVRTVCMHVCVCLQPTVVARVCIYNCMVSAY